MSERELQGQRTSQKIGRLAEFFAYLDYYANNDSLSISI
jgi:hypothetical protein